MRKISVKEQKVCDVIVKKIIRRYKCNVFITVAIIFFVIVLSTFLLYCTRDMGALMFAATAVLTLALPGICIWIEIPATFRNSASAYKTLKTATKYKMGSGAASTFEMLSREYIHCSIEIIMPEDSVPDDKYYTTIHDIHDVYAMYSDETKMAVIIDPGLVGGSNGNQMDK